MTQAARSNLPLRRPPTATTASSRTTPLRSRGAPIGWPCCSPATPPARPSTSRPTTGHAARCCSCPATGREVRRHPLCRVLPHQRVLKRTYPDCRFGRRLSHKPQRPGFRCRQVPTARSRGRSNQSSEAVECPRLPFRTSGQTVPRRDCERQTPPFLCATASTKSGSDPVGAVVAQPGGCRGVE